MKKYRIIRYSILVTVLICCDLGMLTAKAASPDEVASEYFRAIKDGNAEAIKYLLTDDFYQKRKNLLENNPYYSQFLKKFYKNSDFYIVNTVQKSTQALVEVVQKLKDGSESTVTLTLTLNEKKSGDWRIADEVIKP